MYVTGVLAQAAEVKHISNSNHHTLLYSRNLWRAIKINPSLYIMGHVPNSDETLKFWESAKNYP